MGDTVPGQQQRLAVDLPILRREAAPEVRMEVVQGGRKNGGRCCFFFFVFWKKIT